MLALFHDRAIQLAMRCGAMETLIYITEVAKKYGHAWIENDLRRSNEDANPGLFRIAGKMATGAGSEQRGHLGPVDFIEIRDPWNAKQELRDLLRRGNAVNSCDPQMTQMNADTRTFLRLLPEYAKICVICG